MQSELNPTPATFSIAMVLLDGHNAGAAHAFLDPFRSANYLRSAKLLHWQWLGLEEQPIAASNGSSTASVKSLFDGNDATYDLVVINASWNVERFNQKPLLNWIRSQSKRGAAICGLDTGAFILGYAGLLAGKRATVHYEHIAAFREIFPDTKMLEDLYTIDGNTMTCCGGTAVTDFALEILRQRHGLDLANAAGRYVFHDRLRPGQEGQFPGNREPVGPLVPARLRDAVFLMECNLEHILPIGQIASHVKLSQRQLERLFKTHTNVSPIRYYLDIRLDRARGLVTQTELPIFDIAIACGFSNASQFSRAYRKRFALPPKTDRIEGRVPFQFRSFPSHAGI